MLVALSVNNQLSKTKQLPFYSLFACGLLRLACGSQSSSRVHMKLYVSIVFAFHCRRQKNSRRKKILTCLHVHLIVLSLENMTPLISHKAGFESEECHTA
jgi:hypothetical protein